MMRSIDQGMRQVTAIVVVDLASPVFHHKRAAEPRCLRRSGRLLSRWPGDEQRKRQEKKSPFVKPMERGYVEVL
jgi:hypothetical protein